ncbi:hypothetical protein [Actinomyces minihominis]|uniref:hypothetical protein n=1 Tax=Actinomyces minihominis TaxID=2002838 RepID=UPI000C0739C9|nr:hypothetical protein [Actinomyces minihominis]
MFVQVLGELVRIDRARVFERAKTGAWYHLGPNSSAPPGFSEVTPDLSVFVESSTHSKLSMLRNLFETLTIDPDELVFTMHRTTGEASDESSPHPQPEDELVLLATSAVTASTEGFSDAVKRISDEFVSLFGDRRVADPRSVLGEFPAVFAAGLADRETVTEAEVNALISSLIDTSESVDPAHLWRALNDGTVLSWLEKMA